MDNPLISVIIPVYQTEQYLARCIKSILNQTYQNIEIILVDDGSMDMSGKICDLYQNAKSNISVIHQMNSGVSASRNHALLLAKGMYIGFVDSDDWIEPDMYEVLINNITNNNADISVISFCADSENNICEPVRDDRVHVFEQKKAIEELFLSKKYSGQCCSKLFRKELFIGVEFPTEIKNSEDLVVCAQTFIKAQKVVFQEYKCYHYLQRNSSAIHSVNDSYWTVFDAINLITDSFVRNYPEGIKYLSKYKCNYFVWIAMNLSDYDQLNDINYRMINQKIKQENFFRFVLQLGKKEKIWYIILLVNRELFNYIRQKKKDDRR